MVWSDETSTSSRSDSTSTPRKKVSGNSCKNLMAIKRSDQKLWPFRTGNLVCSEETSASPSGVSISTPRKTASGNSSIILRVIQRWIKSYGPFKPVLWSGASRPPPHRVAIPHLLQRKQRPETLL
jgi:hypothetical protein